MTDALPYARPDAVAPLETSAALDGPLPGTRWWFVIFVAWMAIAAALALYAPQLAPDPVAAMPLWILALMCFYLALCNTFFPAPTAWIILLAAAPDYALIENPAGRIALVAGLATCGTIVANLNEYHLLAYFLQFGLGARIRRAKVVDWALRWFNRAPFQLLALVAFVPIPVDALRWLAVLRRYPRTRFALAYLLGRGPRYALFAACSVLLALTGWQILLIQGGIVALALIGRLAWRWLVPRPQAVPVEH